MVWFSVFLWMSLRVNAPSLMDSHAIKSKTNKTKQNKTKQNKTILSLLLNDCGMRRKCRIGQCRTGECIFSWDSLTDRIRRAWDLLLMSLPIKSNRYVHSSNYAYKIVSLLLARLGLLRTWVIFSYYAYYAHYSYTRVVCITISSCGYSWYANESY